MSMKTIARGLVAACCAVLGLTALAEAPTPVVVFNGDLINGAHKNGKFEVSKRTGDSQVSIADGFASLTKTSGTGAPQGVKIAWAQDTLPGTQLTVLVKYSGFEKNSGRTALLSAEWGTYDVSVSHSWDKKFNAGFYTHGSVGDNAGTERTASAAYDIPASGIMMVAMNSQPTPDTTAGTRVAFYDATTSALVEKWRDSGLRWKDSTFKNILVGGTVGPENHYYRPTMTVEAVAIFDKALTIDEANEYVFPTLHRITDVSGEVSWNDLMEGRNFVNGDDVAIVMSGSSTITLPETPVLPGSFSVFGTGDMTIPAMNFPVVSGTQVIWARGFSGEALTKEGTNRLRIQNGDDNGSAETYEDIALDGTTVNIIDGKVELRNGHNNDARFNNATFNIGTYGDLDCYGWIYGKGTMTISNATDKTVLTNDNGNNGNLKDVPNIVKKGEGKLTMTCNLNSSNAITSTIDIQAGTLCLKNTNNKTLNGAITGAGSLEIDVGADHSVKLGSNAITMASIIVTSGALDVAGQKPSTPYTIVAKGGTIKSSGSHIYANENSIKSLTLEADSSLTGGHRFGLTTSNGAETTLDLGAHTLNVASGTTDHCINFRNTTVTGAGTIAVADNSFMLVYGGNGESMVANEAKLTMTSTAKIELNTSGKLTVKDFEAADGASIIVGNAAQGTLKVLGTYKNTNNISKLELANGATIDIASIPENGVVASATQTLTIDDIATIKLAIAGTETTDYTLSIVEDGKSVVATPVKTPTELFLDGIQNAAEDGTVTLTDNISIDSTIAINKSITIDLGGNTLTGTDVRALWIKEGMVTIKNGTVTIAKAEGAEEYTLADNSSVIRVGDNEGTAAGLVLESTATVTSDRCYGITYFGKDSQTIVIDGSVTVTGTAAALSGNGTSTNGAADVTVNGTVSSTNDYAIYNPQAGKTTINGAISGKGGIEVKAGTVTIGANASITATGTPSHTVNNDGNSTTGYAVVAVQNAKYKDHISVTLGGTINGTVAIIEDTTTSSGSAPVINSAANTYTIEEGYVWAETTTGYTLAIKPQGPTSWEDVEEVTTVLPEGTTTTIDTDDLVKWAEDNGVTFEAGITIPVNALIFNVAPDAVPADPVAAADAILEDLASKVDISKMTAGTLDAATLELLEKEYPMATIKLVPSTKIDSTETAKFFQLSIELK